MSFRFPMKSLPLGWCGCKGFVVQKGSKFDVECWSGRRFCIEGVLLISIRNHGHARS